MMKQYCLALDLKDDPELINEYKKYHAKGNVWPQVIDSIKQAGIRDMQIYLLGNRLFMTVVATDDFSFAQKQQMDLMNNKVQEWEALMSTFQQALPGYDLGSKWQLMERIFDLNE
ncbi:MULTISPECIES: L-rhamnose mutarotase [unclassified Pseudoalteromonas]|uniref:L-rhamnose mutarotase n=1 Tax=unclassified Pseudoalteromonas TaxID=194690 RepID=UPI0025B29AA6|nr:MULTISPECIES: L-rhamnose mutarotase [unclassified Pseudoalteromonas]MDN3377718.1 L-rhamnose mutarotase [Pseudoalteromonas sp. APC 3893]MDN3385914.1 L-rhamnose mutarotase [Pseudoalteromonas sp. APC 4017]